MLTSLVAQACNPSTEEAEMGGYLQVQGHPALQSEFKTSLSFRETLSQKVKKKKNLLVSVTYFTSNGFHSKHIF